MNKMRFLGRVGIGAVVALLVLTLAAVQVEAAPPPSFLPSPAYGALGLAQVVYTGGSVADLEQAAGQVGASGVWVQDASGRYQLLPVGAPPFVRQGFAGAFPTQAGAANFPTYVAVTLVAAPTMSRSGIQGTVTLGPTTPVCRVDVPCDRPYVATLSIQDSGGVTVAQTQSGADGRYVVYVSPGRYSVVPMMPSGQILPRASAVQVAVIAGQLAVADIQYDSGIR